jgi:energy-coupling factor transport system substrate-specific component
MTGKSKTTFLALVVVCAGLNIGVGTVVSTLKLPFFLDSIGTVLASMLGGVWAGIACALLGTTVGSAFTPTLWAYSVTAMAIAVFTALARRAGYERRLLPTILLGLVLGVVTAVLSAPVTTFVWKGVTLSGADALVPFLVATGQTLLTSALLSGLSNDPVDKLVTSLIVFALLQRVPRRWLDDTPAPEA